MADTCQALTQKAYAYLAKKTADWPDARLRNAVQSPQTHAATANLDAAILANDLRACSHACRQWCEAILAQYPGQAAQDAAAALTMTTTPEGDPR